MADATAWFLQNWFSLLQSLGVIVGLLFTSLSIRQNTHERRIADLLTLAAQHRDLWSEFHRRPELQRVQDTTVDLVSKPVTPAEAEFLNVVFVHYYTGWLLAKRKALPTLEALTADAGNFFRLPLPKTAWLDTRSSRDPAFVCFIEDCIAKAKTR